MNVIVLTLGQSYLRNHYDSQSEEEGGQEQTSMVVNLVERPSNAGNRLELLSSNH